jgi:hypothetical protein
VAVQKHQRTGVPRALGGILTSVLVLAGCASEAPYVTDEDSGSTHALVSVERSRNVTTGSPALAGALAGFVRIPATVDGATALAIMGLELRLPDVGRCASSDALRDPAVAEVPTDPVELLSVGDVSVVAAGAPSTLAPRAFPTVTDLISGVVYTTRDLSADPLPADASYLIRTAGSSAIEPIELAGRAPRELGNVTVGGGSFSEVRSVSSGSAILLTWSPGESSDLVYVELTAEGTPDLLCAFRDEGGVATVPAGAFAGRGAGRFTLHRVRSQPLETSSIQSGELRFDFELAADVNYTE